MPTIQGKYWCWTLNNPTEEESLTLSNLHLMVPEVKYIVYQKEIGSQGTCHFQGYLELTTRKTLRQTKVILGTERIHIERRRGSAEEARTYCMKEDGRLDGPWEQGDFSGTVQSTGAGARTDLATIRERIRGLVSLRSQRSFSEHGANITVHSVSIGQSFRTLVTIRRGLSSLWVRLEQERAGGRWRSTRMRTGNNEVNGGTVTREETP